MNCRLISIMKKLLRKMRFQAAQLPHTGPWLLTEVTSACLRLPPIQSQYISLSGASLTQSQGQRGNDLLTESQPPFSPHSPSTLVCRGLNRYVNSQ